MITTVRPVPVDNQAANPTFDVTPARLATATDHRPWTLQGQQRRPRNAVLRARLTVGRPLH
jgi:methylthioribose-1-phosphate isomerase